MASIPRTNASRNHMMKPELLSPAGDFSRLEAAVLYGADAVYLGGKAFGMRSSSTNFSPEDLVKAVDYAHEHQVKIYLTCNTLPTNAEADALPHFIRQAVEAQVDALIVADIGTLMLARRIAPDLEIHISTQAGVVNYRTATELYHLGASRVVLAREVPLSEIAIIREKSPPDLELEAFVHGAMCMSFSGRCLISQYLTGRDANRGQCAQPCRWRYYLMEEKRPGQFFPIEENDDGSYFFNANDLCMLPYLDQLARAGIHSFKIEGRAKSPYYVASITHAYRNALDLYTANPSEFALPDWILEEMDKTSHRPYSTGFYFPEQPPDQCRESGTYVRDWDLVATVDNWKDGFLICTERNRFAQGDELEILHPLGPPTPLLVQGMEDEEGQPIEIARHPMMKLRIPCLQEVPSGSMLRRKAQEDSHG